MNTWATRHVTEQHEPDNPNLGRLGQHGPQVCANLHIAQPEYA